MAEKRSRKRIVEEKRLDEITVIAEDIIANVGLSGLTLQEVISKSSISRGTFYKQFPSKETVLTYLGIKGINYWLGLLEKAISHPTSNAREKMFILYAGFALCKGLKPINFQCIFIANSEMNRICVSDELNMILDDRIGRLIAYMDECLQLAIAEGNFKLSEKFTTQEMAFFIWSSSYGAMISSYSFPKTEFNSYTEKFKLFTHYLLDSMNWHPLSSEHDYKTSLANIFETYYGAELEAAKKRLMTKDQPLVVFDEPFFDYTLPPSI
jgi:AcrR family transcriptional regulator